MSGQCRKYRIASNLLKLKSNVLNLNIPMKIVKKSNLHPFFWNFPFRIMSKIIVKPCVSKVFHHNWIENKHALALSKSIPKLSFCMDPNLIWNPLPITLIQLCLVQYLKTIKEGHSLTRGYLCCFHRRLQVSSWN